MNTHRVNVFDRTDDNDVIRLVSHELELVFLPPEDGFFEQNLGGDRRRESLACDAFEIFGGISEA
ncbi:Uncharacterised protein [Chlamydia trachomatis]|nr:Uncharacterised protein [Chlamydia trachomatis]